MDMSKSGNMQLADFNLNIQQVIEVTNKDTNEISFLVYSDNEWKTISQEEYKKIIGEK